MAEIASVEVVERWVFDDLASSGFDAEERERVVADLDRLEKHLTVWNRELTRASMSCPARGTKQYIAVGEATSGATSLGAVIRYIASE